MRDTDVWAAMPCLDGTSLPAALRDKYPGDAQAFKDLPCEHRISFQSSKHLDDGQWRPNLRYLRHMGRGSNCLGLGQRPHGT